MLPGVVSRSFLCAMADEIRFDGRVVLVTGAGGGLGKEYALAFAEKGASVVVNDLGGSATGDGKSVRAADQVVEEIRSKGGKAVADYHSVEDGDKVVQTALDAFGRIDIVVNNAGILRDKSFARISNMDWDLVHRVHLRGSFLVTRAAWPHMRKQKFGRIVMTTSTSGIFGNFGQANYAAAKLGLLGLSNTLALEGAKYNIQCNTIAPVASSRLTKDILPADLYEELSPKHVVPLVLYLCSDVCEANGELFQSNAGWHAKLRWQRSKGALLHREGVTVTPEMVRDNWDKITDWEGAEFPTAHDHGARMSEIIELKKSISTSQEEVEAGTSMTYTERDVILYAMGIGVVYQPDYSHLKFLYEGHEDFSVLPTFGVIALGHLDGLLSSSKLGLDFDPARLLHGEQYIEVFKPFPKSATVSNKSRVVDILDKGKGAVLLAEIKTLDESGETVCINQATIFLRGAGGFGGKRNSDKVKPLSNPPAREPDASIQEKTSHSQAALYRLSGDYNPLHIDPSFSQMGGFDTPILHGLCSYGIACRHVLKQYANNDVTKFKAMNARFVKPVIPGQTIKTNMWKEGSRIIIECKVVENGNVVLSGGYIDLTDVAKDIPDVNALVSQPTASGLKSQALFDEIKKRISSHPDLVKQVNGIFQWNVTKDGKEAGMWIVDLKNGSGAVLEGPSSNVKADCTITMSDDDLVAVATGNANPQQLFMKGKMKLKGNIMLSMKLDKLFKEKSKM